MKIKRISMTGFKSFMDQLVISLPGGISAIVGPNGCGKSNMVDAIRWAMGEQSAKLLRGRSMEDVIFNGADSFKPMGMAEVSLIFENGDGSFPKEFEQSHELAVTRRLYRSGESEYLINNVPCRLKDIQEVFMDTGLGNRAYSIIGQGMISYIVDQKPEETRAMLEEAAGITKYKRKVEESRRKIELTKGNLIRVEDILNEVQRQIRSLKYQASKARRFKTVGQEIQRLTLTLTANSYYELKEESNNRRKSTEDLVREEIALSTTFSGILAETESMNLELEEKDNRISDLREDYLKIKETVNRKESLLESMNSEKRMQVELKNRLTVEKEDLGRRLEELNGEEGILKEKIENVRQLSTRLEEEINLTKKRVQGRQTHLSRVKEEYEGARDRLNSGKSMESSLTQESGYLTKRIGDITDSHSRLEKEKCDVSSRIDEISKVSERKTRVREAMTRKLEEIERDIASEKKQTADLEKSKEAAESALKSSEADLNMNEVRLASLRSLTENFEGYKAGVRNVMKADHLDARRGGRIMGLVADFIQVEPQYEQAIEAVLADKLQFIIVEGHKDGKEAIEYLKEKAKGRSNFIPLKDVKTRGEQDPGNGFPLLRNLVSVTDTYRPIVDLLMGDAVLIPDLDQALAAWANNGKDRSLVTPEGDIIDGNGIISGGRLAHNAQGLLSRKREIKELADRVVVGRQEVEALTGKLDKISLEIEQQKASLSSLTEEKWDCQEKINEFDKAIFRLSHELDQLEKLFEKISDDLEKKSKEHDRHSEELKKIISDLEHCREKREKEETYVFEKEVELKESEEEFEQLRTELNKLKMDQSLSLEEERGFLREIERIEDFAIEAQQTSKRIERDIDGAQRNYLSIEEKEEGVRESVHKQMALLEQAQERANMAEQERHQFRNKIREEEKRSEALRGDLEILKEKIHRAKMEQSEIGFKMDSLIDQVREKFNLDLTSIHQQYLEEDFSAMGVKEKIEQQKKVRERLGEVNLTAIQEHEALKERHTFISEQREDLLKSIESLHQAIRKINKTSLEKFRMTFSDVDKKLKEVFPILFSGGTAGLKLLDETKPLESGVLVEVRPPGKKLSHMGLLSGGEKALVAMALIFAIYLVKPSPFCLLDEVDAPLDEANIDRFNNLLNEIKKSSQVILVTHNRRSMEIVDRLYGVTMEKKGVSKLVSVDLQGIHNN